MECVFVLVRKRLTHYDSRQGVGKSPHEPLFKLSSQTHTHTHQHLSMYCFSFITYDIKKKRPEGYKVMHELLII